MSDTAPAVVGDSMPPGGLRVARNALELIIGDVKRVTAVVEPATPVGIAQSVILSGGSTIKQPKHVPKVWPPIHFGSSTVQATLG